MARYLTADSLITDVKRRGMIPSTQKTFENEDFLMFANQEMDIGVVPHVLSFHEEYYVSMVEIPITTETRYIIPSRAIGNKLREVRFKDDNGNLYEMTQVAIEDEPYFQYSNMSGRFRSFSIEGNEIVLNVTPESNGLSGFLQIVFYIRPNTLVLESNVAKITAINTSTKTVTIDKFPSGFSGITTFDITSSKNPYNLVAIDVAPTTLPTSSSFFITFSSLPKNLNIGDVVSVPEETSIVQAPLELHSMLSQRVVIRCLEALGDTQGVQNAMAKLTEMEQKTGSIIDNRVEGASKKVNNLHSHLRNSRKWFRR